MPLQATSGAASYDGFGGGAAAVNYIEDVFSTYLYNGNGSSQTITNGIDLSGKGGLVWVQNRSTASIAALVDTARGAGYNLASSETSAQALSSTASVQSFLSNGFTVGTGNVTRVNGSSSIYTSWTFRKQPKFFDVVTYTGTGSARTVAHNLGSVPGMIVVKRTDTASIAGWYVYHRSLNTGAGETLLLNSTNAASTGATSIWNNTVPTSTQFTVGTYSDVNASGGTYVAYLFAHDAGGFGLSGADNVISCGSFVPAAVSGDFNVNLGYEPQWIMYKAASGATGNWIIVDNMRGMPVTADQASSLSANLSSAEVANDRTIVPTATGFRQPGTGGFVGDATYIYIAIRRGPMKTPTSGTSVLSLQTYTGDDSTRTLTTGFPVDLAIGSSLSSSAGNSASFSARLTGTNRYMNTASTGAEVVGGSSLTGFAIQTGVGVNGPNNFTYNYGSIPYVLPALRRAPGFFDVVCYTGDNGTNRALPHNLQAVPELVIIKCRSIAADWLVWTTSQAGKGANLNSTLQFYTNANIAGSSTWTSSTIYIKNPGYDGNGTNGSGQTYVAYLFATVAGVSKVGSYTGTGATQVINCGFTGGARFVLIKSTSAIGDWYVWDSARGIVAGNDPYLLWNANGNQVTNTDWVDTAASGFELSNNAGNLANSNGVSYIFLAIA